MSGLAVGGVIASLLAVSALTLACSYYAFERRIQRVQHARAEAIEIVMTRRQDQLIDGMMFAIADRVARYILTGDDRRGES